MATLLWVEDQSHWIDKFQSILQSTDFDGRENHLLVYRLAEAAKQQITLTPVDEPPDLAILDARMNGNDQAGFGISAALHKKWPNLPIIYLSEHSGTGIEAEAFEHTNTQDFIAKHQRNVEQVLCWRIKAILRQRAVAQGAPEDTITSGELRIDLTTWEVYWCGQKLMNPTNPKRPLPPMPRKILRQLVHSSPRGVSTLRMAEALDLDEERFSYASYRQHIKTLRYAFDRVETNPGEFIDGCKHGKGIVTFGDEGAYCWVP